MNGDTWLNGLIAGVTFPVLAYFLITWLNGLMVGWFEGEISGFSLRFVCILSVMCNILPIQIFYRQRRDIAGKATMIVTMIYVFAIVYYFRNSW